MDKLEQAARQAIQVLVKARDTTYSDLLYVEIESALNNLGTALKQPEQTDWQHLKRYGYAPGNYMSKCHSCGDVPVMDKRAITCKPCAEAMHAALEQPEPEPVAMLWKVRKALALASAICDRVPNRWHHTHEIGSAEADIGDMVNAHPDGAHGYRLIQEAEAELVAYLTTPEAAPQRQPEQEPEQEPVAWMYVGLTFNNDMHGPHLVWKPEHMDAMSAEKGVVASPLFTHPPRREWRGLTDDEISALFPSHLRGDYKDLIPYSFAHAIEAALKEKNHG